MSGGHDDHGGPKPKGSGNLEKLIGALFALLLVLALLWLAPQVLREWGWSGEGSTKCCVAYPSGDRVDDDELARLIEAKRAEGWDMSSSDPDVSELAEEEEKD